MFIIIRNLYVISRRKLPGENKSIASFRAWSDAPSKKFGKFLYKHMKFGP